jgi:hypothetical protein
MGDTAFVCEQFGYGVTAGTGSYPELRYREIEDSQFHRALAIAGPDPILTDKLQSLYKQILHGNAERLQNLFQRSVDGSTRPAQTVQSPTSLSSLLPLLQEWPVKLRIDAKTISQIG